MDNRQTWNTVRTWCLLTAGAALYAFGLQYFILPNHLMEGGLTGVSVLLNYALHLPVSATTIVINIPLFLIGWRRLGRESMVLTIGGTVMLSLFLWIAEHAVRQGWLVPFTTEHDFILVVLYAGLTLGIGLGLVFRAGGTTGGTDIIARIIYRGRGISMGQVILMIDVVIIGSSLFFIPKEKVLYTLVSVFIASKMIDFMQEGVSAAKAFTVICEEPRRLAAAITRELDRGVTLMPAVGAFSGSDKMVLYCVVSRFEIRKLKSLVRLHDKRAFIVINDVHDVLGEGFREEE